MQSQFRLAIIVAVLLVAAYLIWTGLGGNTPEPTTDTPQTVGESAAPEQSPAEPAATDTSPRPAAVEPRQQPAAQSAPDSGEDATPDAVLSGRVITEETRVGLPGKEVFLYTTEARRDRSKRRSTTTKQDGAYRFDGLPAGEYQITLAYRPFLGQAHRAIEVSLEPGETREGLDLHYPEQRFIRGSVVSAEGQPVPGATVIASTYGLGSNAEATSAQSQRDGSFEVPRSVWGGEVVLWAKKEKQACTPQGPFQMRPAGLEGIVLTLDTELNASISGTVVDRRGSPVEDVEVTLRPRDTSDQPRNLMHLFGYDNPTTTSGSRGEFHLGDLLQGSYQIRLEGEQRSETGPTLQLAAGEQRENLELTFDVSGNLAIEGVVLDTQGQPIQSATVRTVAPDGAAISTQTDASGRFSLQGLDNQAYTIFAGAYAYRGQELSGIQAGTRHLEIEIEKSGAIEGQVLDARTSEPIEQFEITYQDHRHVENLGSITLRDSSMTNSSFTRFSDPEGRFRLDSVLPNNVVVFARAEGYKFNGARVSGVHPGTLVSGVTIYLERGGAVHGTVVDTQGNPIDGAVIYTYDAHAESAASGGSGSIARTNSEGEFTIESYPEDQGELYAYHVAYNPGSAMMQDGEVTIVLDAGGAIEGTVTSGGTPMGDVSIQTWLRRDASGAEVQGYDIESLTTNQQGRYQVEGLKPGTYLVRAAVGGMEEPLRLSEMANVANGQVTRVDFNIPPRNAGLKGRVTAGNEGSGAQASLRVVMDTDHGNMQQSASTSQDGHFEIRNLPIGTARVRASLRNGAAPPKTIENVELVEGQTQELNFDFPDNPQGNKEKQPS